MRMLIALRHERARERLGSGSRDRRCPHRVNVCEEAELPSGGGVHAVLIRLERSVHEQGPEERAPDANGNDGLQGFPRGANPLAAPHLRRRTGFETHGGC